MAEVETQVTGVRLPGLGWRFDLYLSRAVRLVVVVEDRGLRHLMITRPGRDDAVASVSLRSDQALTVAALLTGARFAVHEDTPAAPDVVPTTGADGVVIESVAVGPRSPVVGITAADLRDRWRTEAELLAVICEQTPEIVEDDPLRDIRPGDRLVVAVRRSLAEQLLAPLRG